MSFLVPIGGCDAISEEGRCYNYFTSGGINWNNARANCQARGGDLATITSDEENNMVYSIETLTSDCWIGLNDVAYENVFKWADGDSSSYRYWDSGEPNNLSGEDCVSMRKKKKWNDISCGLIYYCYFCSTAGQLAIYPTILCLFAKCIVFKTKGAIHFDFRITNCLIKCISF